jgi:hypothetical protein
MLKGAWNGLYNLFKESVCNKQEGQSAYKSNIETRVVTIVSVDIKSYHKFLVCVLSLSYAAYKAHAWYYIVICDLYVCTIFFHIIFKWHDFWKNNIEDKLRDFNFPTTLVRTISHSKRISARYYHKSTCIFMQSVCYTWRMLINSEFSLQIFDKIF